MRSLHLESIVYAAWTASNNAPRSVAARPGESLGWPGNFSCGGIFKLFRILPTPTGESTGQRTKSGGACLWAEKCRSKAENFRSPFASEQLSLLDDAPGCEVLLIATQKNIIVNSLVAADGKPYKEPMHLSRAAKGR